MNSPYCVRADNDCQDCYAFNQFIDYCSQEDDLKGNDPGYNLYLDAIPKVDEKREAQASFFVCLNF